jgi:hypothetical protein
MYDETAALKKAATAFVRGAMCDSETSLVPAKVITN